MHAGENRTDGRHWCAPDTAEEGEDLVFCDCGKVWSYDVTQRLWSELADERTLPELDQELPAFPPPGEMEEGIVPPDEERQDEVEV